MLPFKKAAPGEPIETPVNNKNNKWLLPTVIAVIFILIILIIGIIIAVFESSYSDKFYPGSRIGRIRLEGLNIEKSLRVVDEAVRKIEQKSIQVEYDSGTENEVLLLDQIVSQDVASNYFEYDINKTIHNNFSLGRQGNWSRRLFDQLLLWSGNMPQQAEARVNNDYLKKAISDQLMHLEIKEKNASPVITCQSSNVCQVAIRDERSGQTFNYDEAIGLWSGQLAKLDSKPIILRRIITQPEIKKDEVSGLIGRLQEFISKDIKPEYFYQEKKWQINKSDFAGMIDFEQNKNNVYISINQDKFLSWFDVNIGQELDVPAQNATIQVSGGKITSLSSHKNGQSVDKDKAYFDLKAKIINQDFNNLSFELSVISTTPEVMTENVNDLGIKEIIGVGESNFAGSPTNRRKNIKNGANKLQGLLIKPDEEFSLINTLLPVDASTGYFTELVIKGNKTVPEYGGGLCQIGTTVFRAALSSGLPIVERQNHSYSVTYYLENGLPGVDATIYDPKPDLRFKNDTGHYILIQYRIDGDKLYFEFWGTKDGRQAERTKPKTWGLKKPAPPKLIETTDLAPGVKKCTEKPHNGLSASFDYIVKYPDDRTATTTFTSVYKPWQEVCLIGVAATSTAEIPVVE